MAESKPTIKPGKRVPTVNIPIPEWAKVVAICHKCNSLVMAEKIDHLPLRGTTHTHYYKGLQCANGHDIYFGSDPATIVPGKFLSMEQNVYPKYVPED